MASPSVWGVMPSNDPVSLADVMSEQLVHQLQITEPSKLPPPIAHSADTSSDTVHTGNSSPSSINPACDYEITGAVADGGDGRGEEDGQESSTDVSSDLLLAAMLQAEFDAEYDAQLAREEQHHNGQAKVRVSYCNFRRSSELAVCPSAGHDYAAWNGWLSENNQLDDAVHATRNSGRIDDDQGDDGVGDVADEADVTWQSDDRGDQVDDQPNHTQHAGSGAASHSSARRCRRRVVTKHNAAVSSRRNASKLMNLLPPDVATGDDVRRDGDSRSRLAVDGAVLNSLRRHVDGEQRRRGRRVRDKSDVATCGGMLDADSRLTLLRLVNAGWLRRLDGVVSCGKEAYVFRALGGAAPADACEDAVQVPTHCAVKVFKTVLSEFGTRDKYIRHDWRFRKRMPSASAGGGGGCGGGSGGGRRLVRLWAEKEWLNLRRMVRAGLRCPRPVVLKNHVLVMSLIGDSGGGAQEPGDEQQAASAAPQLRHCCLTTSQWRDLYGQTADMMRQMYVRSRLVHGDLSEYNLLYHEGVCWMIDVGQAVETRHPHALLLLHRDCVNVTRFFGSRGVVEPVLMSPDALLTHVTGLSLATGEGSRGDEELEQFLLALQREQKFATSDGEQEEGDGDEEESDGGDSPQ